MTKIKIYKDKFQNYRIAVIGSGIAGLTSAMLLSKKHNITLYESNNYLGGHALTLREKIDQGKSVSNIPFDVGFLVYNEKNYPLFTKLLKILKVKSINSNMSFCVSNKRENFEYGSNGILSFTDNLRNVFKFKFWFMFKEISKFYKISAKILNSNFQKHDNMTVNDFLKKYNFSNTFIQEHFLPMCGAIWSIPFKKVLKMPLFTILLFFNNHGLLNFFGKPQWKTIYGGSRNYIKALTKKINGNILINEKVIRVIRKKNSVVVKSKNFLKSYDKVIFATHSDDTLQIIDKPTMDEIKILSKCKFERNYIHIHQDESVMPNNKKTWSSWNVLMNTNTEDNICVTYWINKLQNIKSNKPILVTLNAKKENFNIEQNVLRELSFKHPILNEDSRKAVKKINNIQGKMNSYYVGAWLGYGFHEDGVKSAVEMVKNFNISF